MKYRSIATRRSTRKAGNKTEKASASLPASCSPRRCAGLTTLRPLLMAALATSTIGIDQPPSKMQRAEPSGQLIVKRLSEFAKLPMRGTSLAAGYDLSAAHPCVIPARGKGLVKTDLAIIVPEGCYGRIAPRSGLAWKNFIDTGAGVIDADYRGNVGVILFNHADEDFKVERGDRVAQLILERIYTPDVQEVTELDDTARGGGGFGSTGVQGLPPGAPDVSRPATSPSGANEPQA